MRVREVLVREKSLCVFVRVAVYGTECLGVHIGCIHYLDMGK